METLITAKGAKFYTNRPVHSNTAMVLDSKGNQVLDILFLTGNQTIVEEFGEKTSMVEVKSSFGTIEINEDFIWHA